MKKIKFLLMAVVALFAAMPATAAKKGEKVVKFTTVNNYFHRNDAQLPTSPLFTTQAAFDGHFAPAARMGKDGMPTSLNFKKQAVLAIVLPETDRATEIYDVKLTQKAKNILRLAYTVHIGQQQGYTTQPMTLIAIDGRYRTDSIEMAPNIIEDKRVLQADYHYTSIIDPMRHQQLSIDYPKNAPVALTASIEAYESGRMAYLSNMFCTSDNQQKPYKGSNGDFDKMLNHYAELLAQNMMSVDKDNDSPYQRSEAIMNIRRVDETADYVSFESTGYAYTGGAHGMSLADGATFNKHTGQQARLVVDTLALRQLITKNLPKYLPESNDDKAAVPMPQSPAFLKGGKVVFLYQTDEIAAHAAGEIRVEFWPYDIRQFLTPEGHRLTGIE